MSKRNDTELIQDIIECINRIKSYTEAMDYDNFRHDHKTQDAVIRNVEIIGEAVKLISDDLKKKYTNIPWKEIAGTRDKLIHDYFGVNIDIVWNILKQEIPELGTKLKYISDDIKKENG
ncbi:MAG: DUF86 domain-containing protein [Calditrichaeota bacterium]|nr:DUF86 domain-containing protein [Calditrichota bacterium]